jgi:hypothetical protein
MGNRPSPPPPRGRRTTPWSRLRLPPLPHIESRRLSSRLTLDEARAREHGTALTWEKEKTITHHL